MKTIYLACFFICASAAMAVEFVPAKFEPIPDMPMDMWVNPRPDLAPMQTPALRAAIDEAIAFNKTRSIWRQSCFTTYRQEDYTVRPSVKVLEIKRPWIQVGSAAVVRVTDEEWAKLVKAFPKGIQNPDSKHTLTIYGPEPEN